jgi:RNA polymerase sigma-70 factor (ECF subfamily)
MFEEGRMAWPDVVLDRPRFEQHVAKRAATAADRAALRAPDVYLACACAAADPHALKDFESRYLSEVPAFLARYNANARFVDDVRQQVRERLFVEGKIAHYSGKGSLGSWLRVVTLRVASNLRRQDKPHSDIDEVKIGTAIDPELGVIQERYGEAFRIALRDAIAGLATEDRNLVRLHYLEGLNIDKIGALFHVARATVGRRVIAVRERILHETHRLIRDRLNATPTEVDSLLRLVRSRLEVSLTDVLRD